MSLVAARTIPWWRTSFGPEVAEKLAEAVADEHVSLGPVTAEFERRVAEALGVKHVVACTSGSTALVMALTAAGVERGDEVVVPNRTWIATAHAAYWLGAKVVLVDTLPDRPVMDVELVRRALTPRTKAVMPVHLGGRAVDMPALRALARERGLRIIEDCAQALFSRERNGDLLGTKSDAGCFSMSMAKLLPTGQGGFTATSDDALAARLRMIRAHGVADVINSAYTVPGCNFRPTDLQSAVGLVQLGRVARRIEQLKGVYARYARGLAQIPAVRLIPVDEAAGELPLYCEVLSPRREALIAYLAARGIQTRPFYPDLDKAEHLKCAGEFPNARVFGAQGLYLPCGPEQAGANIERVLEALREFGARGRRQAPRR